nr:hypothetical protein [Nocardioidaceae bacterium]
MRFRRPQQRLRHPANLPTAAVLGLTLCASALSSASAGVVDEAAMSAAEAERSYAGLSSASSPPARRVSTAERVAPRVTDVPLQAVSAARREAVDATVERVKWADGALVAHVVRTSLPEFAMVGVTWDRVDGLPEVTAQVRSLDDDGWSEWAVLHAPDDEGPSTTEEPGARAGTQPGWVGGSTGFEIAVYADKGVAPRNLEVNLINPGTSPYDARALAEPNAANAQSETLRGGPLAGTFPGIPPIITRAEWGADDSLGDKCFAPRLGSTFKMVFVHHTAGSNDYEEYESPAVVRGILA